MKLETIVLSFVIAFAATVVAGKLLIPVLQRLRAGQSIREDGPRWHVPKAGTPTMGGLIFFCGIAAAVVLADYKNVAEGEFGSVVILAFALVFGAIGFADDYVKVKKKQNLGLTALQKLLLQLAVDIVFVLLLRHLGYLTPNLYIPFIGTAVPLPEPVYLVFAAFVIVGTVNAVNITDGIDGLVSGVTLPVAVFFTAAAAVWGYTSIGVFGAALAGGLAGFLIFNYHPAKVFMGDTGALFLGGAVCGLAFALDMPLILVPVGLVYVVETLSDLIQIAYFKLTHGKRIFKMAPLHHHLEMSGWSEKRIFWTFSLISLVMCAASYFAVAGRFAV